MKSYVTCADCKRRNKIATTTLIQTHWYELPHGCIGGDNWYEGERQFVCRHCGTRNRFLFNDDVYDSDLRKSVSASETLFFRTHRKQFKQIVETFDKKQDGKWVNNFSLSGPSSD